VRKGMGHGGCDKPKAKAPHLPTEGRYGPQDMWATSVGHPAEAGHWHTAICQLVSGFFEVTTATRNDMLSCKIGVKGRKRWH
jgi:hypothetical protein